jgi:ACS family sodium-dependent inorganic phosphate cotransporter
VLLGSTAVWAIVIGHFCSNWSGYVMLSWAPFYLLERFGVDFHAIGLYVMAPSIVSFLFLNGAGALGDALIARGLSVVAVRKLMQTIGFGGPAAALLALTQVETAGAAVAVMCVSTLLGAAVAAGFACNHLDIAPRHAGALMGLSNTAGTIPGVIGVTFSGWLVDVTGSWSIVFLVAAAIKLFGLAFFLAVREGREAVRLDLDLLRYSAERSTMLITSFEALAGAATSRTGSSASSYSRRSARQIVACMS